MLPWMPCARPARARTTRNETQRDAIDSLDEHEIGPVREAMARSRSSSSSKAKKSYCCPTRTAVVGSVCMHHARVRKTNRTNPPSNHEPNGFSARTEPNHGALHHRCIAASATIVDAFLRRGFGRGDDGSLPDCFPTRCSIAEYVLCAVSSLEESFETTRRIFSLAENNNNEGCGIHTARTKDRNYFVLELRSAPFNLILPPLTRV